MGESLTVEDLSGLPASQLNPDGVAKLRGFLFSATEVLSNGNHTYPLNRMRLEKTMVNPDADEPDF